MKKVEIREWTWWNGEVLAYATSRQPQEAVILEADEVVCKKVSKTKTVWCIYHHERDSSNCPDDCTDECSHEEPDRPTFVEVKK